MNRPPLKKQSQQPPVIVTRIGRGKKLPYYTQECQRCFSELQVPQDSLKNQWVVNTYDKKQEQQTCFYCPVCRAWIPFQWNCKELVRNEHDILDYQRQQQQLELSQQLYSPLQQQQNGTFNGNDTFNRNGAFSVNGTFNGNGTYNGNGTNGPLVL